ncbi:MAG: type II toxin-antitoxin system HicB family antitoxin [Candidatus Brocadia sp.]|nr:type II toxin-antitoxin system HicB family antitoxin [Candidatus Brocadia sp.]
MKTVTFREYITEILKTANYEKGESSDAIIAEAPCLPGCFTQGRNFEEARENLIDAIELWVTIGLKKGEKMPVIHGCRLAADAKVLTKKRVHV